MAAPYLGPKASQEILDRILGKKTEEEGQEDEGFLQRLMRDVKSTPYGQDWIAKNVPGGGEPSDLFGKVSQQYENQQLKGNIGEESTPSIVQGKGAARMPAASPITEAKVEDKSVIPSPMPATDDAEMKAALDYQKQMLETAGLGNATARLGAGIAGLGAGAVLKPATEGAEDLKALGENSVKSLLMQRKSEGELIDLSDKKAMGDPNSDISNFVRSTIQNKMKGVTIPEGLSAQQVLNLSPLFRSIVEKEMNEWQRLRIQNEQRRLDQADDREARLGEQFDFRKKQYGDLTPKQAETVIGYDNVIGDMDNLEALKPAFDTGAIAGRVAKFRAALSADNQDVSAFKNKLGLTLSNFLKSQSGLTVNDRERAFLESILPNMNMSDETFLETLKMFRKTIEENRNRTMEGYRRYTGKAVEGMMEKNVGVQQPQKPETREVNGVLYQKVTGGWQRVK